jgi:hypothetical protein
MNPHLLSNIRPSRQPIVISGIGGTLTVTLEGECPHFGTVYYADAAPCNVLSFALVADSHAISLQGSHQFTVTVRDAHGVHTFPFKRRKNLYICNFWSMRSDSHPDPPTDSPFPGPTPPLSDRQSAATPPCTALPMPSAPLRALSSSTKTPLP